MKQQADKFTSDLFSMPTRGRPRKPNAKTAAQRQADYRARQKLQRLISVTSNKIKPMNFSTAHLPPEKQIKSFTLSYPDFCLLLTSVSESIERDTDLLVRLGARSPSAPDRFALIVKLRAERESFRLLLDRLTGERA